MLSVLRTEYLNHKTNYELKLRDSTVLRYSIPDLPARWLNTLEIFILDALLNAGVPHASLFTFLGLKVNWEEIRYCA